MLFKKKKKLQHRMWVIFEKKTITGYIFLVHKTWDLFM